MEKPTKQFQSFNINHSKIEKLTHYLIRQTMNDGIYKNTQQQQQQRILMGSFCCCIDEIFTNHCEFNKMENAQLDALI